MLTKPLGRPQEAAPPGLPVAPAQQCGLWGAGQCCLGGEDGGARECHWGWGLLNTVLSASGTKGTGSPMLLPLDPLYKASDMGQRPCRKSHHLCDHAFSNDGHSVGDGLRLTYPGN